MRKLLGFQEARLRVFQIFAAVQLLKSFGLAKAQKLGQLLQLAQEQRPKAKVGGEIGQTRIDWARAYRLLRAKQIAPNGPKRAHLHHLAPSLSLLTFGPGQRGGGRVPLGASLGLRAGHWADP